MKKLTAWCKSVRIAMIERDIGVGDLAEAVHLSRTHTSAVINGRLYAEPAIKAISDYLNVANTAHQDE